MSLAVTKPTMGVRLGRAVVWLIPFAVLAVIREILGVPDEMLVMPANGIPPTRIDGLINLATACSLWFGVLGFLARLVRDDSHRLAAVLVGLMVLAVPWTGLMMLYILFT
jgi:hypothetical protein